MISEDEAFWAGIAVAVMMLGGGFSMLFLPSFTGFGAVILALGLMTMALTIQARAKPLDDYVASAVSELNALPSPSAPIESPREKVESQPTYEPPAEAKTEQQSTEPAQQSQPVNVEPNPPRDQPTPEPAQPQQPPQPQVPVEDKPQPPKPEEKPKEEPPVVAAAS